MIELASTEKKRGGDIARGRLADTKPPGGDDDHSPAGKLSQTLALIPALALALTPTLTPILTSPYPGRGAACRERCTGQAPAAHCSGVAAVRGM